MEDQKNAKKVINSLIDKIFDLEDNGRAVIDDRYTSILKNENLTEEMKKMDSNLLELYQNFSNGFKFEWIVDDENNIRGCLNFSKMEHVIMDQRNIIYFAWDEGKSICNYHPLDYISEEASCGIYIDAETGEHSSALYYHYHGEDDICNLDIDFMGYIDMVFETKGFFYWPKVLLDIQNHNESPETKRFKEEMPKLFSDFNWDAFVDKYESLRLSKKQVDLFQKT